MAASGYTRSGVRCSSVRSPGLSNRTSTTTRSEGEDDVLDEPLLLDVPTVAAHELHACARKRDLERTGVRGVREVEADDLAELRVQ